MITRFKIFENSYLENWKIGDIVVPFKSFYDYHGRWIKEDNKYKIVDIEYNDNRQSRIQVEGLDGTKFLGHYHKYNFMTEAEYDRKKYNI